MKHLSHLHGAALLALALMAGNVAAADAPQYIPYNGKIGYQEMEVAPATYYLAFHGDRSTSGPWVDAAWAARAAQLCAAKGSTAFVALRYIEEAVLPADAQMSAWDALQPNSLKVATAPIYIPIYIPSGPRNTSIDAPGKAGPVRCLPAGAQLREPARAVQISTALEAARAAGIAVK